MTDWDEIRQKALMRHNWGKIIAVTGRLGSGKTEFLLSLASAFKAQGERVTIVDVDITNPYFCVREIASTLQNDGYEVITPPGDTKWSDLPLVSSEVHNAILEDSRVLLDIGGDAKGALALTQLLPEIEQYRHTILYVINPFRPMSSTDEEIDRLKRAIEETSGLSIDGLICNPNLGNETTSENVISGYEVVKRYSMKNGTPLYYLSTTTSNYHDVAARVKDVAIWPLARKILMPWERSEV